MHIACVGSVNIKQVSVQAKEQSVEGERAGREYRVSRSVIRVSGHGKTLGDGSRQGHMRDWLTDNG